ncbi:MAG: choice-of-anchor B family protein [Gemmatimonadales bacterium]
MPRLLTAAPWILLAACGGGATTPDGADPTAASITITPGDLDFDALGVTATLTATVRDAEGNALPAARVNWSRGTSTVVQVNASGVVTAIGNGEDQVVATAGGATAAITVRVQQVPVSVAVTANRTTLGAALETAQVQATVRDANNRAIPGATPTFASTLPEALPVDAAGRVTAAAQGSALITATVGALSGSIQVNAAFNGPLGPAITGQAVPCVGGSAGPFPCSGVSLQSYLPITALGGGAGIDLNDIWGWTDPTTAREYALVGRRDGIAFVDVTTATAPRFLGFLPITVGATPNVWHDVKVHADHAFIVADGAGPHGMQVFDLRQLRGLTVPRQFTPTAVYTRVNSAHNMVINEATGFGYIVGASGGGTTCGGGLHMVNLQNPATPTFAGCFADVTTGRSRTGYTHDAQCVVYHGPDVTYQGREICFGSNETALSIADVTSKSAPVALSHAGYPAVSYTHQGWLTEDHRYFYVNDELDELNGLVTGTRTLIWDVQDLDDPVLAGTFLGPTSASDHNNYVRGSRLFASNYQFGMRVVGIANPTAPVQLGFFDTSPQRPNIPGFEGSWSNYPFFPSGNIVVTSGEEGLFVLRVP